MTSSNLHCLPKASSIHTIILESTDFSMCYKHSVIYHPDLRWIIYLVLSVIYPDLRWIAWVGIWPWVPQARPDSSVSRKVPQGEELTAYRREPVLDCHMADYIYLNLAPKVTVFQADLGLFQV